MTHVSSTMNNSLIRATGNVALDKLRETIAHPFINISLTVPTNGDIVHRDGGLIVHLISMYFQKAKDKIPEQNLKLLKELGRLDIELGNVANGLFFQSGRSGSSTTHKKHEIFSRALHTDVYIAESQFVSVERKNNTPFSLYCVIAMFPFFLKELKLFSNPEFFGMENLMRSILQAKDDEERAALVYTYLEDEGWFTQLAEEEEKRTETQLRQAAEFMATDNIAAELQKMEDRRKQYQRTLQAKRDEMMTLSKELRQLERDILGLVASEDNCKEKIAEVLMFLKGMKDVIRVTEVTSTVVKFNICTVLEDVDQNALRRLIARPETVWGGFYRSEWGRFLIDYILLSDEYRFLIQADWDYQPLAGVDLRCDLANVENNILVNYHINHYACISGYLSTLGQYNHENDVIGALYTAIKATKNHNVLDSTVSCGWIDNVLSRKTLIEKAQVTDRAGNTYTVKELKAKYDSEQKGSVSNEENQNTVRRDAARRGAAVRTTHRNDDEEDIPFF